MGINISKPLDELLSNLIEIPSITGSERPFMKLINYAIKDQGLIPIQYNNNLILDINNSKNARTIAFIGHLDTVHESKKDHTIPKIKDGELWGLGACDMKAGLACMLKTAYDIHTNKIIPKHNIKLIFYDGEEGPILRNGITSLLSSSTHLNNIDFAYVLEPTNSIYGIGCLGSLIANIEYSGISAHSANPWNGKNALYGNAISFMQKISEYPSNTVDIKNANYVETLNITGVNTNNSVNKIPDKITIILNYRYSPLKEFESVKNEIESLAIGASKIDYVDNSPPYHLDIKNYSEFLDENIKSEASQFWSDMVQLNKKGIPSINFGPGKIEYAHSKDERININELNDFYQKLIKHV